MQETNPSEVVKSIYIIETYVLETDPYRGCIIHVRRRKT